ncbi:MAG TPA: response regulator [Opitutaceae bacterium]|nr:response regulator [Opitutaceae bacterium]
MDAPRILLIEDDPPSRLMLSRGLQRLGYAVDPLPDAIEAQARIRAAGAAAYAAAVVDLRMPKMDGFEFITWLEHTDPNLGCMLLTAQQDEALNDEREHPALLFKMQKPTSFPVLGEALARIVEFTQSHRAERTSVA